MLYPVVSRTRRIFDICGIWKFKFDPEGKGLSENWHSGLKDTVPMVVPASFNDFFTDKYSREYTGDFWYETDFIVPEEWKGKNVAVRFDAATHRAEVYVNGVFITKHEGGFLPFTANINDAVKWNEKNKIVVHMNNELSYETLPAGTTKVLKNGVKMSKPFFDFFNYSGLQRPVRLIATPKEGICSYSLVHRIDGSTAFTDYEIKAGSGDLEVTLLDDDGNTAAEGSGASGTLEIKNAKLWEVLNPYLYTLRIRLKSGAEIIDEYSEAVGIRTIEVKGTDILVNGKPVYLKGFGKHEESALYGRGYNPAAIKRDFELMKWIGANSFRTAHYPYSEEILQMADREGFLVIDEVAAVGFFESIMNFLEASSKKTTGFFTRSEVQTKTKENHKAALKELIERDKNHACVIAWSLMNEPETTNEAAVPYFKEIFDYAAELDPQKRPRTFALIMNSTPDKCFCYQFADIICLNRYYGWYHMGGYEITDAKEDFIAEMNAWKEKNLNKPFIFSEFGADTMPGLHKLPSVMWSEEYQREYLKMQFDVFDAYDFVKGEQVWNFADFQTTEGIMRVDGNKKGIFTRDRQPKEAAYMFKERWEALPREYKS